MCIPVPRVDGAKCTYCGRCAEACAYHAMPVVEYSRNGVSHEIAALWETALKSMRK